MQSFSLPINFTLANMNYLPDSLLQFTNKENEENLMSGINIPWFYYGNLFSTFCWHIEDLFCYSINYLHSGSPKIWYSIPTNQKHKFEKYVKNKYYAIILKDPNLLHRLTVHISPLELIENNIQVYRTIQRPGEIIVTMPCGYHSGFSTGFNLGEAVNFTVSYFINIDG